MGPNPTENTNCIWATFLEKRFPYTLELGNGPVRRFVVSGFPFGATKPVDRVEIGVTLYDDRIEIMPDLTVTQRWDTRTDTCLLQCKNEEWTAEQISQMALDRLFFG